MGSCLVPGGEGHGASGYGFRGDQRELFRHPRQRLLAGRDVVHFLVAAVDRFQGLDFSR